MTKIYVDGRAIVGVVKEEEPVEPSTGNGAVVVFVVILLVILLGLIGG